MGTNSMISHPVTESFAGVDNFEFKPTNGKSKSCNMVFRSAGKVLESERASETNEWCWSKINWEVSDSESPDDKSK